MLHSGNIHETASLWKSATERLLGRVKDDFCQQKTKSRSIVQRLLRGLQSGNGGYASLFFGLELEALRLAEFFQYRGIGVKGRNAGEAVPYSQHFYSFCATLRAVHCDQYTAILELL